MKRRVSVAATALCPMSSLRIIMLVTMEGHLDSLPGEVPSVRPSLAIVANGYLFGKFRGEQSVSVQPACERRGKGNLRFRSTPFNELKRA